ncbi:DUF2807 domain-containing protein [Flavobacterium sp. LS1R49]|uniref:DUF2807 domain-containing protein n=1 Tax=Flavobacterium shii TaxID=2987687 RepID=A0A9X2ZI18_9FLAO|nr:DUF2807 domain-containing protein [Flavobacterium shii]MCV9929106.1 DUF2807 domain-containing protein [Flavobacterium shii]
MKNYTLVLLLLVVSTTTFAQKKEKIKGSKTVTITSKEIGEFNSLEINDNLEVYLERGEKNEIKIEADDNLHEIIATDLNGQLLRLYTSKDASIFKKLIVRVTYTKNLIKVIAKNTAVVNAIQEVQLDDITFNSVDYSKLFLNVNSKKFALIADDKSKIELNLKSENASVQLSKNAGLKALVAATDFKCDLYQKSNAAIEGNATNATFRLDNNSVLTGNKFTVKNANLTAESYTTCSLLAETTITIAAGDKAEVQLLGTPKIELTRFTEEAKLVKRLK